MKKFFIILGNGFTIDFLDHYNKYLSFKNKEPVAIDVRNLFRYGETIGVPWNKKPGFLSYKNCPALWTLGARPNQTIKESNELIEEIISCANMFFDFINDPVQKNKRLNLLSESKIYLRAYSELIVYLRQLFAWYDSLIREKELNDFINNYSNWGWLSFFKNIKFAEWDKIVFVTYNYDVWLERILKSLNINYNVYKFNRKTSAKIDIIKPHGSISFIPKKYVEQYTINYNINVEGTSINDFKLTYDNLTNYSIGAIIPPAGDSSRLKRMSSWSSILRKKALELADSISNDKDNIVIMCGISYWHVDRREIDELLINLNPEVDFIFINPSPPRDLNAVLISIFKNYILQTSSKNIGGIVND